MTLIRGISGVSRHVYSKAGDGEIIAASSGKKIRILAIVAYAAGGTTTFETGSGAPIIGPINATSTVVLPFLEAGWAETVAGEGLNVDFSGTDQNEGLVIYAYV